MLAPKQFDKVSPTAATSSHCELVCGEQNVDTMLPMSLILPKQVCAGGAAPVDEVIEKHVSINILKNEFPSNFQVIEKHVSINILKINSQVIFEISL